MLSVFSQVTGNDDVMKVVGVDKIVEIDEIRSLFVVTTDAASLSEEFNRGRLNLHK